MLHSPITLYYWYKSLGYNPDQICRRNPDVRMPFLGLVPIDSIVKETMSFPTGTRQHLFLPKGDYFREISLFSFTAEENGLRVSDGIIISGYYAREENIIHHATSLTIWDGKKDDGRETEFILSLEEIMRGYFLR